MKSSPSLDQILEGGLYAFLELLITHHKTTLLISADEGHSLICSDIELVQTSQNMAQVDDRPVLCIDLVEYVVPE